ncbi:MAG TPA: hypothetical protein VK688_10030 [Gemmatimonadales bacterium]|nr:hypothetical protein [Gemmatimonadales bacterium]
MSAGARYLCGMLALGVGGVAVVRALPSPWRAGWLLALGITLLVQGPLGWWLVSSLGRERFFAVWVLGMLLRLLVVAVTGLLVVPALGWSAAPVMLALVGFLVVSLALEGIVSAFQYSRTPVR